MRHLSLAACSIFFLSAAHCMMKNKLMTQGHIALGFACLMAVFLVRTK